MIWRLLGAAKTQQVVDELGWRAGSAAVESIAATRR
jgi:hypothetical protein